MKNNYNPFTVPDGFFESVGIRTMARLRNRRRAIRYGVAAMVVAAALVCTPILVRLHESPVQKTELASSNLAMMYEYDIFLQVNFIEQQ